jgi:Protein of unknown function (DUF992)
MNCKTGFVATAIMSLVIAQSIQPAWSQSSGGVKAGVLTCNVASGWSLVFGSTRDLKCTFSANNGHVDHYSGHINKYGVDIGYTAAGVIAWAVLAPTSDVGKGALAGTYGGVTGSAAVGVGAGANVLVGGSGQTISLQPLSVEGLTGLNIAAGIAGIVLHRAK